ncbi:MFS transporter [Solicola gregarius]|uniref:MFS transporter n=1 Tax=Solicola gregarius TaxID=2908642 RepID=A0AA46TE67_9ACTN|nr:MFS transporter [Solicola gregarius]UYM03543.1 MFS transporter [Solicola gregarius]
MTAETSAQVRPPATSWTPIVALAFGIGMLVASEFLPASVLPALAADVGVSEGTAGLAVAATAIAGAITAPSIAVVLPRADRRIVLVGLLAAAAVANLAVVAAPDFAVLLLGRLLLGVAIAGYWSFAFGAGTHAVPGRDNVVSAALAFGVSFATVLGIPVASLIGDEVGWRTSFAGAAALSALAAVAVAAALPPIPPDPSAGLRMMRGALANRRLMAGVAAVVLVAFGNFAAYPYIRVAIERIEPSATTWLLLLWGIAGVAGTVAAGALAHRLRGLAAVTPIVLALGLLLTATADSTLVLAVAIALWGVSFNAVPVATQLWVTRVEPERAESAMSLQVTAFQVAITVGSALGGALLDGFGIRTPLFVGAVAAAAAGLVWALLRVPRD